MRIYLLSALLFVMMNVSAQKTNTLFNLLTENDTVTVSTGWFINPEIRSFEQSQDFNNQASCLVGGKLGFILNHSFYIGLSGFAKTNASYYYTENSTYGIGYGYGGLFLGKSFFQEKIIHPTIALSAGYGGSSEYFFNNGIKGANHVAGFIYIEPEFSIEINLSQMVRFECGTTFRYIDTQKFNHLPENALDGWSFNLGLIIGNL